MKNSTSLLCLFLLLVGCNNSPREQNPSEEEATTVAISNPLAEEVLAYEQGESLYRGDYDLEAIFEATKEFRKAYGGKYDKVLFTTVIDQKYYFYVLEGKWKDDYWDYENNTLKKGTYKLGLVDRENKVILPVEYDKIYNVGATVDNLMEVEKNGKLGLVDLQGEVVVPAEYDGIYPFVGNEDVWLQLRKGDQFGFLSKKGNIYFDSADFEDKTAFEAPSASQLVKKWAFDSKEKSLHPIIRIGEKEVFYVDDPISGNGVLFMPSYLYQLGVVPECFFDWLYLKGNFGTQETATKVEDVEENTSTIRTIIAAFETSGIDGREYHTQKKAFATVNKDFELMDKVSLSDGYTDFGAVDLHFRFLNDGQLLEIKQFNRSKNKRYAAMTAYSYYRIDAKGNFEKVAVDGLFACSRLVALEEGYLQGNFVNYIDEDELPSKLQAEDTPYNIVNTSHLSIEDLDIMRNEIYAAHGYRFKSKKWQDYFAQQDWYTPRHDKVDDKLSAVEKKNAAFLLQMKKKMEGKAEDFLKTDYGVFVAAG